MNILIEFLNNPLAVLIIIMIGVVVFAVVMRLNDNKKERELLRDKKYQLKHICKKLQ